MSAEIIKNLPATLDGLAKEIRSTLDRADKSQRHADDLRITAGQMLLAAHAQVKAQGLAWSEWLKTNVSDRSERDVRRLLSIAKAPDPASAAAQERAATREQVAASRQRQADIRMSGATGESRAAQSVTGGNVTDKPVTFVPPNAMTDKIRITVPNTPAATGKITLTVSDTPETSSVVEDGLTAARAAFLRLNAEQRTPFLDWAMTQLEAQTTPTEPETSAIDVLTAFRALWARASGDECKQIIDGTLKPHFRAEYRKGEREERQAAVEQATRREEVPAPTEDDPAAREIFAKLRSAGTEWIGPSARDRLGIDEDEIDRLLKEGALRQHPTLPCSVGLPA